jgi:hypothetical protein
VVSLILKKNNKEHLGNKEEKSHYNIFCGNITQVQVTRKKTAITICSVVMTTLKEIAVSVLHFE